MHRFFLFFALIALLLTCCSRQQKFDAALWQQKGLDWWMTDVRESMVDDLLTSDTLSGMSKRQVIILLGEADEIKTDTFVYHVREKHERDIDPVYISRLIIVFDNKAYIKNYKLEQTK
jgi:hypothetical protein